MTNNAFNITRTSLALAAALLLSQGALASGYNFGTQSAAAQGTANANGAEADDASVIYANPAGMSRLKGTQMSVVMDLVLPSVEFTPSGTATGFLLATHSYGPISGGSGGDPVRTTFVPHGYVTHQINDQWVAGVGVFVPFGGKVEYSDDFIGRYYAQKTDLKTLNINPSVSYKLDARNSFGFGLDLQYMKAKLQRKVATTGAVATDGTFNVEGDSWGYGFNLGYLLQVDDHTRFGVAYRSAIKQDNKGSADLVIPLLSLNEHADARADVKTPESLSINGYHDLNDRWAVMADLTWTRHSRFNQLVIQAEPITTTYLQADWRDTYKVSVGASYKLNDAVKLRAGYMYDQSPVDTAANVLPTLPDSNRQWLSFGGNWKLSGQDSIDFAYSYVFLRDRSMNRTYDSANTPDHSLGTTLVNTASGGTSQGSVSGTFKSHLQILGVQWNHAF